MMKNLYWHEPTAYRRAVFRATSQSNPWKQILLAAVIIGGIVGFRAYQGWAQQGRPPSWSLAIAIAVAAAGFFAYFVPWLQVVLPNSIVIFSELGINNNLIGRVAQARFFPWNTIGRVVAATVALEGKTFPVIVLYSTDNRHLITLGLKKSPTLDQISEYLKRYDLELLREPSVEHSE